MIHPASCCRYNKTDICCHKYIRAARRIGCCCFAMAMPPVPINRWYSVLGGSAEPDDAAAAQEFIGPALTNAF